MESSSLSNSKLPFTVSSAKSTSHNTARVNNMAVSNVTTDSLLYSPKTAAPKESLLNEKIKQLKESERKYEIINHVESKLPSNLIKKEHNASILKYRSKGEEIHLNGKVNNSKSNELIECRHLAAAFVHEAIGKKMSLNETIKNSKFAMINTAEKLGSYSGIMTEDELENTARGNKISNEAYYFDDKGLGEVLKFAWDKLEQRQCESVSYTFCSLNHAMGLRMKHEPDRPEVRLELYDPNDTAAVMRFIVPSKEAMRSLKISDFFNKSDFKCYFPGKSPAGVLYSSDIESEPDDACVQISGALTPEMIYLLAQMGHLSNKDIKESAKTVLKSVGNDQQKELLECKDKDGTPGLNIGMQNRRTLSIKAFVELLMLSSLESNDIKELLGCKCKNGTPGLFMALQDGHEGSVRAFVELLVELLALGKLESKDIKELLGCKRKDGTPGLFMALQNGHENSVRAFVEPLVEQFALGKLGSDGSTLYKDIKELLECKDEDGTPGLYLALQNGHQDSVRAFFEPLVEQLGSKDIKELLGCKLKNGTPGLYISLKKGHTDSFNVFADLVTELLLIGKLGPQDIKELLECKRKDGVPGLFIAVQANKLSSISSFIRAVLSPRLDLERNDKLELLQASFSGKTVMQRHTGLPKEAVLYYKSVINDSGMLSDDEKKKILGDGK